MTPAELNALASELLAASGVDVTAFPIDTYPLYRTMSDHGGISMARSRGYMARAIRRARFVASGQPKPTRGGLRAGAGRKKIE